MDLESLFSVAKLVLSAVGVLYIGDLVYHLWFYHETEEDLINNALDKIGKRKASLLAQQILSSPSPLQLAQEYEYKKLDDSMAQAEYLNRVGTVETNQLTLLRSNDGL